MMTPVGIIWDCKCLPLLETPTVYHVFGAHAGLPFFSLEFCEGSLPVRMAHDRGTV
jgi:hypothetical protein